MCVYSMVMDHKRDEWDRRYPQWTRFEPPPDAPTKEEIAEFRRLLERARDYDRKNNEPDCEMEEKRAKLRKLAKELGVEIDFV